MEEPDELAVSTHPEAKSGWRRRNLLDEIRKGPATARSSTWSRTSRHGRVPRTSSWWRTRPVPGAPLLDWIREKARAGGEGTSFLIVSPQSDPDQGAHPEADRRLRQVLAQLRSEGIDAHGQSRIRIRSPPRCTPSVTRASTRSASSTFPEQRGSSWLRRDLIGRLTRRRGERPGRACRRRALGGRCMSAHADAPHHRPSDREEELADRGATVSACSS